jgi:hypothetical protein
MLPIKFITESESEMYRELKAMEVKNRLEQEKINQTFINSFFNERFVKETI